MHAYAVVASKTQPGQFYALHLKNVVAEDVDHLLTNNRPTFLMSACERVRSAIDRRFHEKKWSKP